MSFAPSVSRVIAEARAGKAKPAGDSPGGTVEPRWRPWLESAAPVRWDDSEGAPAASPSAGTAPPSATRSGRSARALSALTSTVEISRAWSASRTPHSTCGLARTTRARPTSPITARGFTSASKDKRRRDPHVHLRRLQQAEDPLQQRFSPRLSRPRLHAKLSAREVPGHLTSARRRAVPFLV